MASNNSFIDTPPSLSDSLDDPERSSSCSRPSFAFVPFLFLPPAPVDFFVFFSDFPVLLFFSFLSFFLSLHLQQVHRPHPHHLSDFLCIHLEKKHHHLLPHFSWPFSWDWVLYQLDASRAPWGILSAAHLLLPLMQLDQSSQTRTGRNAAELLLQEDGGRGSVGQCGVITINNNSHS